MKKFKWLFDEVAKYGSWFRLGKTFRTEEKFYFYDTGTGKVFEISEEEFKILDCLFKTNKFENLDKINLPKKEIEAVLENIAEAIKTHKILSAPRLTHENVGQNHINNLETALQNNMHSITLELTEKCNLRCKYCIYNTNYADYRDFGCKNMSFDTAKSAIDFLMEHSSVQQKVSIGFYGGEPLLQFMLIKEIIAYTEDKYSYRDVSYSMTSNMTLMTEDKARFLSQIKKFSLVASIDGPKEIHDENRIFSNGEGTFDAAIQGLKTYASFQKNSVNKDKPIMCSLVMSEPYTEEKFTRINSFFDKLKQEIKVGVLISYVSRSPKPTQYIPIYNRPENDWQDNNVYVYDPLMIFNYNNIEANNFTDDYFTQEMVNIHMRSISDNPMENYSLNSCCIPGSRRLYITTEGQFLPCERVGSQFTIGDVTEGFNIEKIKKYYINDFIEQEIKYCGECWAINICSNCYIGCFGKANVDFSYRHSMCNGTRKRISESLYLYHKLLECHPDVILKLNDIKIE